MIRFTPLLLIALTVSACAPVPISREAPAGPGATSATPAEDRGAAAAPSPSAVLMQQARSHAALGEYPEAAAALERAIRIEPGNPWLWLELARVHYAAGDVRQAEARRFARPTTCWRLSAASSGPRIRQGDGASRFSEENT